MSHLERVLRFIEGWTFGPFPEKDEGRTTFCLLTSAEIKSRDKKTLGYSDGSLTDLSEIQIG
jgi:hypothetical protein